MSRIKINLDTILKRSRCINSVSESADAKKRFDRLNKQGITTNDILFIIEGISDISNAGKYYREPLSLLERLNDSNPSIAKYLLTEYTTKVLPYVEDLSMMAETLDRYDGLTNEQKSTILEAAIKYNTADRILSNHEKISKRFNIIGEINKVRYRGLKSISESCCAMIDTYSIAPYAKFNLCLEELGYILDRECIKYDRKEMVRYVTEYFLLRSDTLSSKDLNGYRKVLTENCYISEDDLEQVDYIKDSDNTDSVFSINHASQCFLTLQEKTPEALKTAIEDMMNTTPIDIEYNIDRVILLLWDVYKNEIFNCDYDSLYCVLFNIILNRLKMNDIDKSSCIKVINKLNMVYDSLFIGHNDDIDYASGVIWFKDILSRFIDDIREISFIEYSKDNINNIIFVNNESAEVVPLDEYKIFRFHNLIRASMNLDKYLRYKEKQIYAKGQKKIRKAIKRIKDILFVENMRDEQYLFSNLGDDSKVDICLAQYEVREDNIAELSQFLESTCRECNDKLKCIYNYDTARCYYIINPSVAEIRIKESAIVGLINNEVLKSTQYISEDIDVYLEQIAIIETCVEELSIYKDYNIEDKLNSLLETGYIDVDTFSITLEALSFLNVSEETINVFVDKFKSYRYNNAVLESVITESEYNKEVRTIDEIYNNFESVCEDASIDIQLEALQIFDAIVEATSTSKPPKAGAGSIKKQPINSKDTKSVDNPNTKVDESRKNPFKGINLNSMRLYLEGLKAKMKDMSTKEKEISRNIDNNFRRLIKGMKDALISDRREAVIKGSVIPSFSKCIKICISLAGIGFVTHNPAVPLIMAIGGFAMSKNLTKKERVLLLDEIETELQVVEKEISMAESKNQMKKYRALLKYKKDLQRQYQRIRYNIRIGKDILPNSTNGVKSFDN